MAVLTASAYRPLIQCQPSISEDLNNSVSFKSKMGGRGEPWNLDDFVAVSRGISQACPRNLAKFSAENCGP